MVRPNTEYAPGTDEVTARPSQAIDLIEQPLEIIGGAMAKARWISLSLDHLHLLRPLW
jgi:hypothetical protein